MHNNEIRVILPSLLLFVFNTTQLIKLAMLSI